MSLYILSGHMLASVVLLLRIRIPSFLWGTLPNIRALAAASSGASTFGKAVISAPLSAPKAPPTPAEAAALAAEYVRQHMGGSGMNADQKKKLLWGGAPCVIVQSVLACYLLTMLSKYTLFNLCSQIWWLRMPMQTWDVIKHCDNC